MTRVLTHQENSMTSKAGAIVGFTKPVALSAANTVITAIAGNYIGIAKPDDALAALNGADQYASGDLVQIKLRGPVEDLEAGGTFAVGNYVKFGTAGKVVVEAVATTRTVDTIGIALEAGTASAYAKIVRFD